jgi:hypothetical protein
MTPVGVCMFAMRVVRVARVARVVRVIGDTVGVIRV